MTRSACTIFTLSLFMLSACGEAPGENQSEIPALPPVPEALRPYELPPIGTSDPLLEQEARIFDIRHAIVTPTRFGDETQLCWLTHPGRVVPIPPPARGRYPEGMTHRAAVQCATDGLESWADLVLDAEAAERYPDLDVGVTIRVHLHTGHRGFRGYQVLSFDGVDDAEPAVMDPLPALTQVATGYDFGNAGTLSASDRVQICSVWSVGPLEPIDMTMRERRGYTAEATTRMTLKCRSVLRETFVDLILDPTRARGALAIRRGHRIAVRILDPAGGLAEYPLVSLEDLMDVEPPPPLEPPAEPETAPTPAPTPAAPAASTPGPTGEASQPPSTA